MTTYEILLVDDDPLILKTLGRSLEGRGYKVVTALSGEEAVQHLVQQRFDLLITDVVMERISGIGVLKRARKLDPEAKAIVITGYDEVSPAIEALRLGADDYLLKPFEAEELHFRIERCLENLESRRELRRAEAALRESEARYRSFVENFQGIAFRVRTDFTPVFFHGAVEEITGYTEKELVAGKPRWERLIHPDDRGRVYEITEKLVSTPRYSAEREYRILCKDRKVRWVHEVVQNVCGSSGKPVLVQGAVYDITRSVEAEQEREELQNRLYQERKAESLGRMAGAVAHHFNNQLFAVSGNLELAMSKAPECDGMAEHVMKAMQAVRRASEVSDAMLTYLGQGSEERELLDFSEVCRRSLAILRATMPKGSVLQTDFPSPGPVVCTNHVRMYQVLHNLVTNAREALNDKGGVIHLRVGTVQADDIEDLCMFPVQWNPSMERYARLEVADTGCGMADEDVERIFDPFFSTRGTTGRGLGLSVVLGIVSAAGGAVGVESEPGRGSVFRVYWPVAEGKTSRRTVSEAGVDMIEGEGTVLLVEDDETVRNMVESMLKQLGFRVVSAASGTEAVEVLRRERDKIRCAITDLSMHGMNGWETLEALREISPSLPVILTSGYDEAHAMAGEHPEEPQAFLHKPYRMAKLTVALSKALSMGDASSTKRNSE